MGGATTPLPSVTRFGNRLSADLQSSRRKACATMIVSLSWYRKPFVAFVAAKKFLRFRATPNSTKTRSNFTFDPATGALVITPNLDLVIRKALMRVRRIKFRL